MKKIINFYFLTNLLLIIILVSSCKKKTNYNVDVRDIKTEKLEIHKYEDEIMNLYLDNFDSSIIELSEDYKVFLGDLSSDTTGIHKIKEFISDTSMQNVYKLVQTKFNKHTEKIKRDFQDGFKHLKYYYPEYKIPAIYTYISGYDVLNPVIYYENNIIIASDMYLGKDNSMYYNMGLPNYLIRKFTPEYVVRDSFEQIASYINQSTSEYKQLLSLMIYNGKNLEFIKSMLPNVNDTIITGFTSKEMKWCIDHEKDMWEYLITDNLLFSGDMMLMKKMTEPAPFTSFFSNESPGGAANWIGWRIVASYRANNNVTLEELMKITDPAIILNNARYRPK